VKLGQVAIFQPGRAGDFVLTTALFNAIKDFSPATHLTVIAGPRARELARYHPAVDKTLVFDRAPLRFAGLLARLKLTRFDLWIDPKPYWSRSSQVMAKLARASLKIGFNRGGTGPFDLELPSAPNPPVHFRDQALASLALAGIPSPAAPRISLGLSPEAERWAQTQLSGSRRWTVFVNISAGSGSRVWPVEHWLELLPHLATHRPTDFLLSSAPEDAGAARTLASEASRRGVHIHQLPPSGLLEIAALIKRTDLVLTVDTAIVHIASAFNRPLVALYLREHPVFTVFQPLSSHQEVVAAETGSPMRSISVASVAAAYRRLAGESGGS
jgi:ADP-heptose:LPS heptosyltransferase